MAVVDQRPDALLERCGAIASRLRLAIAWSDSLSGEAAKRCSRNGKAAWKAAEPVSDDPAFVAAYFKERARTRNPAVVASASGLVLIEADGDLDELCARFKVPRLPATITVRSARGVHRYYRVPEGRDPMKVQLADDGLTVSSDGYLIGAGALHPTGWVYQYVNDAAPASLLPVELYDLLTEHGEQTRARITAAFTAGQPITEGQRNDAVFHHSLELVRAGMTHADVVERLLELNRTLCRPPLPDRRVQEQVAGAIKWARTHPTDQERLRAEARRVLDEHRVPPHNDRPPPKPQPSKGPLGWDWLTAFATKRVVWLDRPFWQASAFHLKVGRKGVGKGTALADLAARFSRGEMGSKRRVVWIGSEDSVSIDVKPRVLAAGGDANQIAVVKDWLQLPRDVPRLEATLEAVGEVGLLVIDPVSNHIAGKNSNDETDVREAIAHLNAVADEFALVAVGVRHLTEKEAKGGLLAAILGSSAWVQVPRTVIALARDPRHDDVVHMQVVAGNRIAPGTPGRRFRIEAAFVETDDGTGEVSRVVWEGDSTVDVEELLTVRHTPEPSRSEDARALILATLQAQPGHRMGADEFDALIAEQAGISAKTVRNLRSELGAKGRGWLKAIPVKDDFGEVLRWDVGLTAGAPQPDPDLPDPGPIHPESGSGLSKPKTGGFQRPDPDIPGYRGESGSGSGSGQAEEQLG